MGKKKKYGGPKSYDPESENFVGYHKPFQPIKQEFRRFGPHGVREQPLIDQFSQGKLPLPAHESTFKLIAAECFRKDLLSLASQLPTELSFTWELMQVQSKSMAQLVTQFKRSALDAIETVMDMRQNKGIGYDITCAKEYILNKATPETMSIANDLLSWIMDQAPQPITGSLAIDVIECAAALGRLDLIKKVQATWSGEPSSEAVEYCARGNHLNILKHFEQGGKTIDSAINGAVYGAQSEIARYVKSKAPKACPSRSSVIGALQLGNLSVLWSILAEERTHSYPEFVDLQRIAAQYGQLELLQFAYAKGFGIENCSHALDIAAGSGHLEVVQWLHLHKICEATVNAMDKAAEHGHTSIVKFLVKERNEGCTVTGMANCAMNGHLEIFLILWEAYPQYRPDLCALEPAARHGHLWIIEFVLHHQKAGIEFLLRGALSGGHLYLADFLVASGAIADKDMMINIAQYGHVASVKWLDKRLHGVYPESVLETAAKYGNVEVMDYLAENCKANFTTRAYELAFEHGRFAAIQFLYNCCPNLLPDRQALRLLAESSRNVKVKRFLVSHMAE